MWLGVWNISDWQIQVTWLEIMCKIMKVKILGLTTLHVIHFNYFIEQHFNMASRWLMGEKHEEQGQKMKRQNLTVSGKKFRKSSRNGKWFQMGEITTRGRNIR